MQHLVSIQILRAIAAIAIALLHALNDATAISAIATPGQPFTPPNLLPLPAGVDLFFVISGFVMVYASESLFGQQGGARRFLARRVTRIVPLYWLTTTVFLMTALMLPGVINSEGFTVGQVVASYLFVPFTRADGFHQPVYSLGWTLNYEMFFYLVFALFIGLSRSRAVLSTAVVLILLVGLGLALPGMGMPFAFWCNPIMLEFVFGMVLAQIYLAGWRVPVWAGLLLVLAGLLVLYIDAAVVTLHYSRPVDWGLPVAMILGGVVLMDRPANHGFTTRAFVALGDASYALYLTHPFAMRALKQVWVKLGLGAVVSPWVYVALTLALAIALSLAVFRYFEKPATIALKARFDRA